MGLNMLELQKLLQNYGVLINFSGRFTQEIIEELGDAVKRYLESETTSKSETFNVFSVFIEQTQNIKNYGAKDRDAQMRDRIANSGIVAIGKADEVYFVFSGNIVENKDIGPLTKKLDEIASLDKDGLKRLYKAQLKKPLAPEATGAGLGLIDMARRAVRPPTYSITGLDERVSFFTLEIYV